MTFQLVEYEQRHSVRFARGEGDSIELDIVASLSDEATWELAIETAKGGRTVWTEEYPSAHAAIQAGVEAILLEGALAFTDEHNMPDLFTAEGELSLEGISRDNRLQEPD
ncbi:MAG: hypothetical protein JJU10_02435 [Idiomarina sp.]|nr:hypothetical protein [Idiomarina sp.]